MKKKYPFIPSQTWKLGKSRFLRYSCPDSVPSYRVQIIMGQKVVGEQKKAVWLNIIIKSAMIWPTIDF